MQAKLKIFLLGLIFLTITFIALIFVYSNDLAVLNPEGEIGHKQHKLLLISTYLMLIVVVPTILLTFYVSWKFRKSNEKATYRPNWDFSLIVESLWWSVPCILMLILGFITWRACHELDPFRPLKSDKKPLHIQVIALKWKWLFIYPEQKIASVNYLQFPEKTPLHFDITSDAPMNSFWIPKLGGQIYAMAGMKSQLNLIADQKGDYRGCSSNLSGTGFSGMVFKAIASSTEDFENWAQSVSESSKDLDLLSYDELAQPSKYNQPTFYRLADGELFDQIIMKYMMPQGAQ